MLYAKINLEGDVEEYPLVADQIRSRHLETSLPFVLDEASLPFGYIVGRKQALEDQIDRAESESEVDSIKFQITLEEIQTATKHYNN